MDSCPKGGIVGRVSCEPIFLPWHGNARLKLAAGWVSHHTSALQICRVPVGQGRSYHIRVTSERSIPIRANPRNSHPPPLSAIRQLVQHSTLHCMTTHRSSPEHLSLRTKMHLFRRKGAIIAAPGGRWHRENAENSADCVCFAPSSTGAPGRGVAFLQFRFYALFTFLPPPPPPPPPPAPAARRATWLCHELVWQPGWSPPWPATESCS